MGRPIRARRQRQAASAIGVLIVSLTTTPASAATQDGGAADSTAAMATFRSNIDAIHKRDRARYLEHYLRSPSLAAVGVGGPQFGYDSFAEGAGGAWPDTLVATHFRLTPLADGVAYGAYRYRFVQGDTDVRGVSERVLVRTPEGWRVAVTTAFPADASTPPPPFALVGATVVDGTGAAPVSDAVVVMREGLIECVSARAECPIADDVEVVDAAGHWIMPGLVDAHVHHSQTGWADGRPDALDLREQYPYRETIRDLEAHPERIWRSNLCSGVTATFDVGGFPWTWALRERAARSTRAPHLAIAGPLLSTFDHWLNLPAERQFIHMAGVDATLEGTRYLIAGGTDAIKVWFLALQAEAEAQGYLDALMAAGEEARAAGVPLIVHATGLWQAKQALRAGARLLVHGVFDREVDQEFLDLMRESGAVMTPTLTVREGYLELAMRRFRSDDVHMPCVDPVTAAKVLSTDTVPGEPSGERALLEESLRLAATNVRLMHEAGLPIAAGTDAGNPLTLHGVSINSELEALQEAGLSPSDVIVAATRNGARAMFRDDFGTLEAGMVADLIVLGADPTADIANVRDLRLIVRGGEIRTRTELEFPDEPTS
ncbi:MAG: amidohydrolase family protein [Gemmatimonadota bacterium]